MNLYEQLAKIADDLHGEGPEMPYDNGGTKDGWNMACRKIAEEIRCRDPLMGEDLWPKDRPAKLISGETKEGVERIRELLKIGIHLQAAGPVTDQVVSGMLKVLFAHIDELEADLKCAIAVGQMAAQAADTPTDPG